MTGDNLRWSFGDRIRKIRRAAGVSQAEFALAIGQGQKSVAAWELGTNEPRHIVEVAQAIEDAYGVPASWTLGVSDPKPRRRKALAAA